MSRRATSGTATGVEVVPLSSRALAMSGFRVLFVAVTLGISTLDPQVRPLTLVVGGLVYLVVTGLFSAAVMLPWRSVAVKAFGISLLVDGIFVQFQREVLRHGLGSDALAVAMLVAVVLLASFRTGLKLAIWQSVLLLVALRGMETGLFPAVAGQTGRAGERQLIADMAALWLAVIVTAASAATNERELRRRRADAESFARFADRLQLATRVEEVATALAAFVAEEVGARRAFVLRSAGGRLTLLADSAPVPAGQDRRRVPLPVDGGSAVLALTRREDGAALTLRLDPARDPWLAAAVPDARRIVVSDLVDSPNESVSVVAVLGRRGHRVEHRLVEAVLQATATASLAWSRAELLLAAERRAATDGLTGLANRRTFDDTLAALDVEFTTAGTPYALVLTDVDKFKSVNDRYGHQAGDEVLQIVARLLMEHAEAVGGVACRYGGEEFGVLMSGVGAAEAFALAERVRLALHSVDKPVRITSSFGVAAVPEHCRTPEQLVHDSDAALIAAKNAGRDRAVLAGDHRMPADAPAPGAPAPVPPSPGSAQPDAVPPPRRRDLRAPASDEV